MIQLKKIVISFFVVGVIISLGIVSSKYFNNDENLISDKTLISYYVETGEGTGIYEKQDDTTWPEGYVLNEEKSTCDNGSTLSWDSSTNSVVVTSNKKDSCKVYFDVQLLMEFDYNDYSVTYTYYAEPGMNWEMWINSKYNTDNRLRVGDDGYIYSTDFKVSCRLKLDDEIEQHKSSLILEGAYYKTNPNYICSY